MYISSGYPIYFGKWPRRSTAVDGVKQTTIRAREAEWEMLTGTCDSSSENFKLASSTQHVTERAANCNAILPKSWIRLMRLIPLSKPVIKFDPEIIAKEERMRATTNELDEIVSNWDPENGEILDHVPPTFRGHLNTKTVEELFRLLLHARNDFAKSIGFANYFQLEHSLLKTSMWDQTFLLDRLKIMLRQEARVRVTRTEYQELRKCIDVQFQQRDPFQAIRALTSLMGLESVAEPLLDPAKSSFYAEPHNPKRAVGSFCIAIDPPRDVRIFTSLPPDPGKANFYDTEMLFHEVGHGIFYRLLKPNFHFTSNRLENAPGLAEGQAMLFQLMLADREFLMNVLGFSDTDARTIRCFKLLQLRNLIEGWIETQYPFEKAIYENPDADFDEQYAEISKKKKKHATWFKNMPLLITHPAYTGSYVNGIVWADALYAYIKRQEGTLLSPRTGVILRRFFQKGLLKNPNHLIDFLNQEYRPENALVPYHLIAQVKVAS